MVDYRAGANPAALAWALAKSNLVTWGGPGPLSSFVMTGPGHAWLISIQVADWGQRGLLNVRCVDTAGVAENAGQLDMRVPEAGALPSNIWGTGDYLVKGAEPVTSHAMPSAVPKGDLEDGGVN